MGGFRDKLIIYLRAKYVGAIIDSNEIAELIGTTGYASMIVKELIDEGVLERLPGYSRTDKRFTYAARFKILKLPY